MPAQPPSLEPGQRRFWQRLSLRQLQRLKHWRALQRERRQHRLECAVWEGILTFWLLGWTAWLPVLALHQETLLPLCLMGVLAPQLYVYGRARAHARGRLRCDWLKVLD